jgi:hypothetical protein
MPSLLELQDLYRETLVREIIEKTKGCGIQWTAVSSVQFKATEIQPAVDTTPAVQWDFVITKTQIGNLSYQYTLDIKKNNTIYLTVKNGPSFYSQRDTMAKELYEIVEVIVLQLDLKMKEIMTFIQGVTDCKTP